MIVIDRGALSKARVGGEGKCNSSTEIITDYFFSFFFIFFVFFDKQILVKNRKIGGNPWTTLLPLDSRLISRNSGTIFTFSRDKDGLLKRKVWVVKT